jgi:hypothetical protein
MRYPKGILLARSKVNGLQGVTLATQGLLRISTPAQPCAHNSKDMSSKSRSAKASGTPRASSKHQRISPSRSSQPASSLQPGLSRHPGSPSQPGASPRPGSPKICGLPLGQGILCSGSGLSIEMVTNPSASQHSVAKFFSCSPSRQNSERIRSLIDWLDYEAQIGTVSNLYASWQYVMIGQLQVALDSNGQSSLYSRRMQAIIHNLDVHYADMAFPDNFETWIMTDLPKRAKNMYGSPYLPKRRK